ncbi:MAG: hypothetical protein OXC80_10690 [Gammaproteobacteria bacterium]|nr:hypothetical protein [Gammaproteobacteria bacterium]
MSVDILRLIEEADENPREFVLDSLGSGAVMFEAQIPRSRGLRVGKEPLEANPYHGEVWPIESRPRFTKSERRFLLEHSKWFVEIEAVRLHVGSPIVQTQTQPK